jgi:hypothetical protein
LHPAFTAATAALAAASRVSGSIYFLRLGYLLVKLCYQLLPQRMRS